MNEGPIEARTIRQDVLPRLRAAGWSDELRRAEYPITPGGRSVVDGRVMRRRPLRADIALLHGEHPIVVVEAKRTLRDVRAGVQQVRHYATLLDLPLAYATNGRQIIEIDMRRQAEHEVDRFRSPAECWDFFRDRLDLRDDRAVDFFTTPYSRDVPDSHGDPKLMRYYQHVTVQRLLRGIARGDRRLLAVLATGAGKTPIAAQLVHVLWRNHWPRGNDRPRVLYLADRDRLVEQPMRDWFRPVFGGDPMTRVRGALSLARHLYFALYQALDHGGERDELFRAFPADWFDLVIVDECHRGSASADSAWRAVLEHFSSAVQIGLTATPIQKQDRRADTVDYFGGSVYTYSLHDGIRDGFLAPFEVLRVYLDRDVEGVHIPEGVRDRDGDLVPAGDYGLPQFERTLVMPERTRAIAGYVSDFLRRGTTGGLVAPRMRKTIIFCVNQDHAARMREELVNLNGDMMRQHPNWAVRITGDEGDLGRELLDDFCREDSETPVVVTTSQLLSTGVDVPTAQVIVLARRIESMVEFKQIIGRGSRLADEFGKEYFTIIDFVGATGKFNDPDFDGPPVRVITVTGSDDDPPAVPDDEPPVADDTGDDEVNEPEPPYDADDGDTGEIDDPRAADDIRRHGTRHVVDGIDVLVTSDALYVADATDGGLRRIRFDQWVRDRVRALDTDEDSLRAQWASTAGRRELRELLADTLALDVDTLAERLHRPDCDPIDLLIALAYDVPLMSRAERALRFDRDQRAFLDEYSPRARLVLTELVRKYAAHGVADLSPKALDTPPISELGSAVELGAEFGGPDGVREAIDKLGRRLLAS